MLGIVHFNKRVAELDFLKGLAVLYMIFDHIMYDLGFVLRTSFESEGFVRACNWAMNFYLRNSTKAMTFVLCASIFLLVSGICASFSKNPLKDGIILTIISVGITVVSIIASKIAGTNLTIWFGIFHLFAACHLLTPLLKKIPENILPILAILLMVIGFYFKTIQVSFNPLVIFNFKGTNFFSADYYPILPHISYYILGLFIGKKIYTERKTLVGFTAWKGFFPLRFVGAYSLYVYVIHQVIIYVVIYLLTLAF